VGQRKVRCFRKTKTFSKEFIMSNGRIERGNYKQYRGWLKFYGLHVGGRSKEFFNRADRRFSRQYLHKTVCLNYGANRTPMQVSNGNEADI
jgi:hypothetical protein